MNDSRKPQIGSFYLNTPSQEDGLLKLKDYLASTGLQGGNVGDITSTEALRWLLENFDGLLKASLVRRRGGVKADTLARIQLVVDAQIELNKTTTESVVVGKGANQIEVRYEQRALTERWIRDNTKANKSAVEEYMTENAEMIGEHNAWLVEQCGYPVEISDFNRRTGKAAVDADAKEVF